MVWRRKWPLCSFSNLRILQSRRLQTLSYTCMWTNRECFYNQHSCGSGIPLYIHQCLEITENQAMLSFSVFWVEYNECATDNWFNSQQANLSLHYSRRKRPAKSCLCKHGGWISLYYLSQGLAHTLLYKGKFSKTSQVVEHHGSR